MRTVFLAIALKHQYQGNSEQESYDGMLLTRAQAAK